MSIVKLRNSGKKLLFFALLYSVCLCSLGQKKILRSDFKTHDKGFKEAWQELKNGDFFFDKGSEFFPIALSHYLKAYKYNPGNAKLNYRIGLCFLHTTPHSKAVEHFQKAYALDTLFAKNIHFQLGKAFHLTYQFDKAIEAYEKFGKTLKANEYKNVKPIVDKKIAECKNGIKLVKNPVRAFVENAGFKINSPSIDYFPFISGDESVLIYSSKQMFPKKNTDKQKFNYSENIYIAKKIGNSWSKPKMLSFADAKDETMTAIGISPDGQKIFMYKEAKKDNIYVSTVSADKWTKPVPMKKKIMQSYKKTPISFSYDMQSVFFVDERNEKKTGRKDIYFAKKNKKGKRWKKSMNIGAVINSEYDEESVFIHPDNRTIYFSSRGHDSMGGYDIFKSVYDEKNGWSKPENLGYPINTPADELYFTLSADGRHAYYASAQDGSMGQLDIFRITFMEAEKQALVSTEDNLLLGQIAPVSEAVITPSISMETKKLTLIKGKVTNICTFEPIDAKIEIVNNQTNEIITTIYANKTSGNFLIPLPFGVNYGIFFSKKGYLYSSENIYIENPEEHSYEEKNIEVKLQAAKRGSKISMKNVFFRQNHANIEKESFAELNFVANVLKSSPNLKVSILSHTDNRGSLRSKAQLSEKRAKSIINYLANKGIKRTRIEFQGCAYLKPVADNTSESGREQNNRVELLIIEN